MERVYADPIHARILLRSCRRTVQGAGSVASLSLLAALTLSWVAASPVSALASPRQQPSTPRPAGSSPAPNAKANTAAATTASKAQRDRAALEAARKAYKFQPGVQCPFCQPSKEYPHGRFGLHWHDHWRAVGLPEYIAVPTLGALALGVELTPTPTSARWDSPILFDKGARSLLRLHSASGRKTAETVSNIINDVQVVNTLVDPLVFAWGVRGSSEVAWQMTVIDAQAFALTLAVTGIAKRLAARERPYVAQCRNDPTRRTCESGAPYGSFFSGHASVTATAAGLVCAHHTQLSLYQNDVLDTGACVVSVLGTAATGMLRIMSDNHWASDVIIGHLVGYVSGYLMPTLLYYREFRVMPEETAGNGAKIAALPIIGRDELGLTLFGTL